MIKSARCIAIAAVAVASHAALGVEKTWLPTSGTFSYADSANWNGGTPGSADIGVFADQFSGTVLLSPGDAAGSLSFRNTSNAMSLDLQGNTFTLGAQLFLGTAAGQVNDVTVTGGGTISSQVATGAAFTVGGFSGSNGNHLTLSGAGTKFIQLSTTTSGGSQVGVAGSNNNTFTISNGAYFQANNNLTIGVVGATPSSGNLLELNNATYQVDASARGVAMVNGTLQITNSSFESTTFVANAASNNTTINFNSGTFYSRACTISNGKAFTIGDGGATPATFVQTFSAPTLTVANGLVINSNGRLQAYGTITGDVSGIAGAQATPENTTSPLIATDGSHFATITDSGNWNNSNIQLTFEPGDVTASILAGNVNSSGGSSISSDRLSVSGTYTEGGTIVIDLARYVPGQDQNREIKLISWGTEGGTSANTSVSFVNGTPLTTEFRSDGLYLITTPVVANSTWNKDGNSTWGTAANWIGAIPYGIGSTANFGTIVTSARTVSANVAVSTGTINFSSPVGYTISSGSTITMDVATGNAAINVSAGSHTIATSMLLNDNLNVDVVAGSTISLIGGITSNNGSGLTKTSAGNLTVGSLSTNALNVTGGSVKVQLNGTSNGVTLLAGLTVNSGASLDITNNGVAVNYTGASPIADIQTAIIQGYASGAWTGNGITSSSAAAVAASTTNFNRTGIGYAEASAIATPSLFSGANVDGSTVLIRYTLLGDANLDGTVGTDDFVAMSANFNATGQSWVQGDFNYDGVVNALDFNMLATNFGAPLASPTLGALVPEPASLTFAIASVFVLVPRRRRWARL